MKAILKLIWFFVVVKFNDVILGPINVGTKEGLIEKTNQFLPFLERFVDVEKQVTKLHGQFKGILIFTLLFLGLDLINGQFKGLKGPFKIVLNGILYLIGFSIILIFFTNISLG